MFCHLTLTNMLPSWPGKLDSKRGSSPSWRSLLNAKHSENWPHQACLHFLPGIPPPTCTRVPSTFPAPLGHFLGLAMCAPALRPSWTWRTRSCRGFEVHLRPFRQGILGFHYPRCCLSIRWECPHVVGDFSPRCRVLDKMGWQWVPLQGEVHGCCTSGPNLRTVLRAK